MTKRLAIGCATAGFGLALASAASAQDGLADSGSSMPDMRVAQLNDTTVNLNDACGKDIGCIVIANSSDRYNMIEVDVDVKTRRERIPRWTNLMQPGDYIAPHKVFMIPRIGDDKFAVVGLRAILRNPDTGDRQTIVIGTIDMRPDPQKRLFVNFVRFQPPGTAPATPTAAPAPTTAPPPAP